MLNKKKPLPRPFFPDAKPAPREISAVSVEKLSFDVKSSQGEDLQKARRSLLWKLMSTYLPATKEDIQGSFVSHIEYTLARSRFSFDNFSAYLAASYSVRDRLIELFNDTQEYFISAKAKQVYYVSAEFLVGRFLRNAILNLGLENEYRDGLRGLGINLDDLYNEEYDPGLGNGGLGRLAACFMDSLATLNYPAWGYGLMYSFGMFKQIIANDGSQMEIPDYWLNFGDPWRIQKSSTTYKVHFYGYCDHYAWKPSLTVLAVANDFLIPGFDTDNTLALRLWSSKPTVELDEEKFRGGDYYEAIAMKQKCEQLTSVLYPNDNNSEGKELRLMQEYFLSSASVQDIIRRLLSIQKESIKNLPKFAAIQLNDTHPTIIVAELIRILVDEHNLDFLESLEITQNVCSYTCHTLMPEALEKWDVPLFENLLPRHMQIIYQINHHILDKLRSKGYCNEILRNISIIEESSPRKVRMANLAVIGSHNVNGVASIHTKLMKELVFHDFNMINIWSSNFLNITNGVTVRRWLHHCNPELSLLITRQIGGKWVLNTDELANLSKFVNDEDFRKDWQAAKSINKKKFADFIRVTTGVELKPKIQLFDVQVKQIHEYKRQQLNIFSIIHRYYRILSMTKAEREKLVPRAMIFGGKAASGYWAAKKLIKLINRVANVVNNNTGVGDLLKVVFIPNYNVSAAEVIIPGSDICEQISTAGTEASGTSNMKFAFNGCLIIGTRDGANIEIGEAIGDDNVFFFGAVESEVIPYRCQREHPIPDSLRKVFDIIRSGVFGDPNEYECLIRPVENGDNYLVAKDFESYLKTQDRVDRLYKRESEWTTMSIISTANVHRFSSDRTIQDYAQKIWDIKPCRLPQIIPDADIPSDAPHFGQGSIGGSLRRHHTAFMQPGEVIATTKSSFGSISRHSTHSKQESKPERQLNIPRVNVSKKLQNDDDDDEEIPIED